MDMALSTVCQIISHINKYTLSVNMTTKTTTVVCRNSSQVFHVTFVDSNCTSIKNSTNGAYCTTREQSHNPKRNVVPEHMSAVFVPDAGLRIRYIRCERTATTTKPTKSVTRRTNRP